MSPSKPCTRCNGRPTPSRSGTTSGDVVVAGASISAAMAVVVGACSSTDSGRSTPRRSWIALSRRTAASDVPPSVEEVVVGTDGCDRRAPPPRSPAAAPRSSRRRRVGPRACVGAASTAARSSSDSGFASAPALTTATAVSASRAARSERLPLWVRRQLGDLDDDGRARAAGERAACDLATDARRPGGRRARPGRAGTTSSTRRRRRLAGRLLLDRHRLADLGNAGEGAVDLGRPDADAAAR